MPESTVGPGRLSLLTGMFAVWALGLSLVALIVSGCDLGQSRSGPPAPPPPPTYTGPAIFHGTVSSLCTLQGYKPLLVSSYGIVIGLPGTGSAEVPAYLRQWLLNELRRGGFGSARLGTTDLSPSRIMTDPGKSVVKIEGLIPPGATRGTRFDLVVTALDSQTTSLEGGRVLQGFLSINGATPTLPFFETLARSETSDLYINPLDNVHFNGKDRLIRTAYVLGGGIATQDREVSLVINQPSYLMARLISDRINERFGRGAEDRAETAEPQSDQVIRINIPKRFVGDPGRLMRLIGMLYLQRSPNFEADQAGRLADALAKDHSLATEVALAWETLGPMIRPALTRLYDSADPAVRLAAQAASGRLNDATVLDRADVLLNSDKAGDRMDLVYILRGLPTHFRTSVLLAKLLDDPETNVRIAAYEALSDMNDPMLHRRVIEQDQSPMPKFVLDLVPAKRPLIYIAQSRIPRIVIFHANTGFKLPMFAQAWDNHLMIRAEKPDQPMDVFYQYPDAPEGHTFKVLPTVANLVFLLAHKREVGDSTDGLDLSFSRVVNAIYTFHKQGLIDATLEVEANPLVKLIEKAQQEAPTIRPDTHGPADTQPTGPTGAPAPATVPAVDLPAVPGPPSNAAPSPRPDSSP